MKKKSNKDFKTFTQARNLLIPRAQGGFIQVNKREMDMYIDLFPDFKHSKPAIYVLDGYKLIYASRPNLNTRVDK